MVDKDDLAGRLDAWLVHCDPTQAEALLECLFDAAAGSFHDPHILRYMVYVLGALQRYDESELAMRAYLQLSLHAHKTSGNVDQHLQATVHHAITIFARAHRKGCAKVGLAQEFATAVQPLCKDSHMLGRAMFALCCEGRRPWSACIDLLEPSHDLVLALIASGNKPRALGAIKELLKTPSNESFLILGNLLCAEEEYERAITAFSQVTTTETFHQKQQVINAQLAIIDAEALLHGPNEALSKAKDVFVLFAKLFGAQQTTPSVPVIVEPPREPPRSQPAINSRSTSLRLKHTSSQPSLLLRKSASARSLLHRHRHVSAPVHVKEVLHVDEVPREERPAAIMQRITKELLSKCWLHVARYAIEAEEIGDALQAVAEAQAISGASSDVLLSQCKMGIALGDATAAQIEARFEVLLQHDDDDIQATLAFASFLMDQKEPKIARAYNLLAPWTSFKFSLVSRLWLVFGQICEARAEVERAQEAYWRAVELADLEGVLSWTDLSAICRG